MDRRHELYRLLGDLPPRDRKISGQKEREEERDGYVLERWSLDLNGVEQVPAWFARPLGSRGSAPASLFNHSHGGGYDVGKNELIEGRSYLQRAAGKQGALKPRCVLLRPGSPQAFHYCADQCADRSTRAP